MGKTVRLPKVFSRFTRFLNRGEPQYTYPNRSPLGITSPSWTDDLSAMGSVGTLYSIVRLLSTSTAQVDWHLYRKSSDGRRVYGPAEDNRVEVTRHLALQVLDNPNPLMTRYELFERTQLYLDLVGESFWYIEKTERGNIPTAIWPLQPDRMNAYVSDQGLIGWTYRQPDGTQVPFTLDEIVHIKLPNPLDMYRGLGPVQALTLDLESTDAAAQYNRMYFRNSASPSGIIQVEDSLDDEEFDRTTRQWRENHGGVMNSHRVAVLSAGMKWVDTTTKLRDMQFVELRNMSRELIREAYGIHKHMLGLSDDVNRANAVAASTDFAKWQLQPRLERIKQALNSVFLPMFGATGVGVEFCFDDPTPEDAESQNAERDSKVNGLVALVNAGADPSAACEAMGLPVIPFEKQERTYPALPQAPVSSVPEPAPQSQEGTTEEEDVDAQTVARLLKEVFG